MTQQRQRPRPNILVTGTPGTGKTTTAELVVSELGPGYKLVSVGDRVKERQLYSSWDDEFGSWVIDEDKVCDDLEDEMELGGVVVEYLSCDFFPERWFDLVVVLQTDNTLLYDRLEKRGYTQKKVSENVQCEIMHVVVEEARESYREEVVQVLPSDTVEEMEENVERIVAWVRRVTSPPR